MADDKPAAEPATAPDPEPAAADFADHPDENIDLSAIRNQARRDGYATFGRQQSGVIIIGDGHRFDGSITGGSYTADGESSAPLLEVIEPDPALDKLFVEPAGFEHLGPVLEDQRSVLLGTRTRWGNTTLAVRILTTAGATTLHRLRPTGPIADLPLNGVPRGAGIVVDATDPRGLATLRAQSVAELRERLRQTHTWLIVVTDADLESQHRGLPVWQRLAGPPSAYDIVLRHLEHRCGDAAQAAALIAEAFPDDDLTGVPESAFDVHRLIDLAYGLADADRGHGTVADAAERFTAGAGRAVEEWLDDEVVESGDPALVLSLAVLNGMPYEAVARATRLLEQRLAADGSAPDGKRRPMSRRARLKAARARLTEEVRPTRYGAAEVEVAAFADDNYPARILRHYWQEHDYHRDLLLAWLREVADDVEVPVATRAAFAAGFLGTLAFDTVRRDVITPWAGSGRGDERELAVTALHLPARSPATAARTAGLVLEWAGRSGPAARMIAARALGGSVGAVLSNGPDRLLAKLAVGADAPLSNALGDSVAELLADATPAREAELLRMLQSWCGEGRSGRRLAGAIGFLQVCWTVWTEVGDLAWPRMLWIAEGATVGDGVDAAAHDLVVSLLACALVAPADHKLRLVMRTWFDCAERHPEMGAAFVRLMTDVANHSARHLKLVRYQAGVMRTGKPGAPDTARKLLDALTETR